MLSGLHAPNQGYTHIERGKIVVNDEVAECIRLGKFRSVKLMHTQDCMHTPADARAIRDLGVEHLVVRLFNTREPNRGAYPAWWAYADRCITIIWWFYTEVGVRDFELDNEPNEEGAWDSLQFSPGAYQWYMRFVVERIREHVPGDVRLISPALSFNPGLWSYNPNNKTAWVLDEWLAAYQWTEGGRVPSLLQIFDVIGDHPYWNSERQMRDGSYGRSYEQMHERSGGKPVGCTEYAHSGHRTGMPPQEVERQRIEQYPVWLREADAYRYVLWSHLFISPGSNSDWQGFWPTQDVSRAMGRFVSAEEQARGQSEWLGHHRAEI